MIFTAQLRSERAIRKSYTLLYQELFRDLLKIEVCSLYIYSWSKAGASSSTFKAGGQGRHLAIVPPPYPCYQMGAPPLMIHLPQRSS